MATNNYRVTLTPVPVEGRNEVLRVLSLHCTHKVNLHIVRDLLQSFGTMPCQAAPFSFIHSFFLFFFGCVERFFGATVNVQTLFSLAN
jgi:hypothetical protein